LGSYRLAHREKAQTGHVTGNGLEGQAKREKEGKEYLDEIVDNTVP